MACSLFFFGLIALTQHNYFEIYLCYTLYHSSFLTIAEQCSIVWICHNLPIHLLMDIWVHFQLGAITNKAAMKTCVQVFVLTYAFISLWQISRVEWMDNMVVIS